LGTLSNHPVALMILARAPIPGRTKTRLIPALGRKGAADLQAGFVRTTVQKACAAATGPVILGTSPPGSTRSSRLVPANTRSVCNRSQAEVWAGECSRHCRRRTDLLSSSAQTVQTSGRSTWLFARRSCAKERTRSSSRRRTAATFWSARGTPARGCSMAFLGARRASWRRPAPGCASSDGAGRSRLPYGT